MFIKKLKKQHIWNIQLTSPYYGTRWVVTWVDKIC